MTVNARLKQRFSTIQFLAIMRKSGSGLVFGHFDQSRYQRLCAGIQYFVTKARTKFKFISLINTPSNMAYMSIIIDYYK